jgi:hypothetical protein
VCAVLSRPGEVGACVEIFYELGPGVSVIEDENGYGNAPQSGAGLHAFAPGARLHAVSASPSSKGINVQGAQERSWYEKASPQSQPLG